MKIKTLCIAFGLTALISGCSDDSAQKIGEKIDDATKAAKEKAAEVYDNSKQAVSSSAQDSAYYLKGQSKKMVESVKETAEKTTGDIKDAVKETAEKAANAASDAAESACEKIKDAAGADDNDC